MSPSGGEVDLDPPKVTHIIPNHETIDFNSDQIAIFFNEYIQIKNQNDIVSFPEIVPFPKIKTKGKSIIIEFEESLKDSTTYIISFNNSIVDINESNILENFNYVFSTGPNIDTCTISGKTLDLRSNQIISGAIIGLYKNKHMENFDSLIRSCHPDYFTLSNKDGIYNFSNIKAGNYILYALQDYNTSKKYEEPESVSMPLPVQILNNHSATLSLFVENDSVKTDTLYCFDDFEKIDSVNFGTVNLQFQKTIYETSNYIGELLLNDSLFYCFNVIDSIKSIHHLPVGEYYFRIFNDLNQNGIWDPGNIKSLKNPEEMIFFEDKIEVKKDWEIDIILE